MDIFSREEAATGAIRPARSALSNKGERNHQWNFHRALTWAGDMVVGESKDVNVRCSAIPMMSMMFKFEVPAKSTGYGE